MASESRIIVALDYPDASAAWTLVQQLGAPASHYKVGLQLLTAAGPEFVGRLVDAGKRVFLDLKVLEIPNSVAGAVEAAGRLGACMVTVHAAGGRRVMAAAVKAARAFPKLRVVAITVITSHEDKDLQEVGVHASVPAQVMSLARLAMESGCDGVVASALEVGPLRAVLPSDTTIVVPGISLDPTRSTDQKRISRPGEAILAGASFVVVGRAITRANDPGQAFAQAQRQITGSSAHD
ncbi:MAG: orotidine-5'-phosphate decarboxylase [Proteobacteria bacterium]|jgi:orotidine-5'-phosphate decarboxylase|nr:orotidine-5'-phosphate decarboxylase [Pseudomonadota bacterium]MDA1302171.1 orotidine-5'-phosphate decarboxylase [Pseudomonadota bacterium]